MGRAWVDAGAWTTERTSEVFQDWLRGRDCLLEGQGCWELGECLAGKGGFRDKVLACVLLEGARIQLEESLWEAGEAPELQRGGREGRVGVLDFLQARDGSEMHDKSSCLSGESSPISQEEPCFNIPAVGSHQSETARRGMASFAPMGLRARQLEPWVHEASSAGRLSGRCFFMVIIDKPCI